MASFLYPRTVSIYRPASTPSAVGASGYNGQTPPVGETLVQAGIPASVQLRKPAGAPATHLPGDAPSRTQWTVYTPRAALAKGVLHVRDILIAEDGTRFQCVADYWNSLGYAALVERLDI